MHRKLMIIIFSLFWLLISSCTSEVHHSDITVKAGLVYRIGDDHPFSGAVLGKGRDGNRKWVCQYKKQYKDGLLHGPSYFWYENGKLESIEPYEKGHLNGMLVRYYPNGKIKARIHLEDGQRGGAGGEMFWTLNSKKK
jgi:hypothetical protein